MMRTHEFKPKWTRTQGVAATMSVPHKHRMTSDDLVGVLRGELDWHPWCAHLTVFFSEMYEEEIKEVMDENNLTMEQLIVVADALGEVWQGPEFKRMRDATVGRTLS
jgi:hypothetical protein